LGLTAGQLHDNRLCSTLLSGLRPRTMVLADRGYDAGWIRALINEQGAWANIPPKRNRRHPICFSPYLYRARNLVERFFNKIKHCRRIATRLAAKTTWRSSSWPRSAFCCKLPRRSRVAAVESLPTSALTLAGADRQS